MGVDEAVVQAERQQVSTSGWGAKLLSDQEPSGLWGGGQSSCWNTLRVLRILKWYEASTLSGERQI